MLNKMIYRSPLGDLSLIASQDGLRGIWFLGQKYFERGINQEVRLGTGPILEMASDLLDLYFAGQAPDLTNLPLDWQGTDFQKRVWQALLLIPFGQTTTYGNLAQLVGVNSGQAIGGAVGRNPISILVPCHRVLSRTGQLTGYAGGLEKKIWLLEHEKADFCLDR